MEDRGFTKKEFRAFLWVCGMARELLDYGLPYSYETVRFVLWDVYMWGRKRINDNRKIQKP